jgi:5-methylcytosine-specific restriction endonuclease McrA
MPKIPVLDTCKQVLEPCHPAVARRLLRQGKAAIYKRYPFTIILKTAVDTSKTTEHRLSIDPGSRCTGMAITDAENNIVATFELHHRGVAIKKCLSDRANHRQSRRCRRLRYRPARWQNRSRRSPVRTADGWKYKAFGQSSEGWVAPSLMSRVFNIDTWVRRLQKIYPITELAVEQVKFDAQRVENIEASDASYKRGTLEAAELWEYLLEKYGRKSFYCGIKDVPLEKEHIVPLSKGGADRASNLTIACRPCNTEKGDRHPDEIHGDLGIRVDTALRIAKVALKDSQIFNTIRWKIVETLKATGLPITYGTGGKTKWHRRQAGLPKTYYYDAASVANVPQIPPKHGVLAIHAVGYGHRRDLGAFQTKQTAPGFKRPYKRVEHADGFQKLDSVEIRASKGTFIGSLNSFDKTVEGKPQRVRVKTDWIAKEGRVSGNVTQLQKTQMRDGYGYQLVKMVLPPREKIAG